MATGENRFVGLLLRFELVYAIGHHDRTILVRQADYSRLDHRDLVNVLSVHLNENFTAGGVVHESA
jgi:hypothetical protein